MERLMLEYNLQFFAEEGESDGNGDDVVDNDVDSSADNNEDRLDTGAFAELISEKDKKIEDLEGEIRLLKKANAELTIKVSAGQKTEKTFEENLLGLVGQPARKE